MTVIKTSSMIILHHLEYVINESQKLTRYFNFLLINKDK